MVLYQRKIFNYMKLSNAKIENDQLVLKFDYRIYGIGDDITLIHEIKLGSNPKQVCEDLVNTANGIIDTLELDMEIKSVEKKSDISSQDLSDRWG